MPISIKMPNNIDEAFANIERENPHINALVDVISNPNIGAPLQAKTPETARLCWTLAVKSNTRSEGQTLDSNIRFNR